MNRGSAVRSGHRWLGVIFTATVVVNLAVIATSGGEMPPPWITYAPLPPLLLLMISGLCLFAAPYVSRWRGRRGGANP